MAVVAAGVAMLALLGPASASGQEGAIKKAAQWALEATFDIPGARTVTDGFFTWLLAIPNFNDTAFKSLSEQGNVIAFALLSAVATFSATRYWLAGLGGIGGSESGAAAGIEGVIRTCGAVLAILAWPWLFEHTIALANATTHALLAGGTTNTAKLMGLSVGISSFNPIALVFKIAGWAMVIMLVFLKVSLIAWLAVLCGGMPFFIMLAAVPELAWVVRNALRAFVVILLAPVAWGIEIKAWAFVRFDELLAPESLGLGDLANFLFIKPLVGLVIMVMLFKTPKHLRKGIEQATAATVGAPGAVQPGFLGRTLPYLAGQALAARLPYDLGGRRQPNVTPDFREDAVTGQTTGTNIHKNVKPGSERHTELMAKATDTQSLRDAEPQHEYQREDRRQGQDDRAENLKRRGQADAEKLNHEVESSWKEKGATDEKAAREATRKNQETSGAWSEREQEGRREDGDISAFEANERQSAADERQRTLGAQHGEDREARIGREQQADARQLTNDREHAQERVRRAADRGQQASDRLDQRRDQRVRGEDHAYALRDRVRDQERQAVREMLRDSGQSWSDWEGGGREAALRSDVQAEIDAFRSSEDFDR